MNIRSFENSKKKLAMLFLPVIILAVLATCDFLWMSSASNKYAEKYLDESIMLAAGTYASCRAINAGVSSIQESSISISPWGVGIEYHVGQLLDPINDATERLSDVCVKSMALVGAQRIILFAINKYTIFPFYLASLLFIIGLYTKSLDKSYTKLGKFIILIFLIRVSIPAMCYVGVTMDKSYFSPNMKIQMNNLSEVKDIALKEFDEKNMSVQASSPDELAESSGFFSKFKNGINKNYELVKYRMNSIKQSLIYFRENFNEIAESLTLLFVLFIEKIILQVFVIPLLTYILINKCYKLCSGDSLDTIIKSLQLRIKSINTHSLKPQTA